MKPGAYHDEPPVASECRGAMHAIHAEQPQVPVPHRFRPTNSGPVDAASARRCPLGAGKQRWGANPPKPSGARRPRPGLPPSSRCSEPDPGPFAPPRPPRCLPAWSPVQNPSFGANGHVDPQAHRGGRCLLQMGVDLGQVLGLRTLHQTRPLRIALDRTGNPDEFVRQRLVASPTYMPAALSSPVQLPTPRMFGRQLPHERGQVSVPFQRRKPSISSPVFLVPSPRNSSEIARGLGRVLRSTMRTSDVRGHWSFGDHDRTIRSTDCDRTRSLAFPEQPDSREIHQQTNRAKAVGANCFARACFAQCSGHRSCPVVAQYRPVSRGPVRHRAKGLWRNGACRLQPLGPRFL